MARQAALTAAALAIITAAPLAATAENADAALPPADFMAGRYALLGATGENESYSGGVAIVALNERTLRFERRVGGATVIEFGRIERNRLDAPVIRLADTPTARSFEGEATGFCMITVDFDNYARLTCVRRDSASGRLGYEAYFPLDAAGDDQLRAFGFLAR